MARGLLRWHFVPPQSLASERTLSSENHNLDPIKRKMPNQKSYLTSRIGPARFDFRPEACTCCFIAAACRPSLAPCARLSRVNQLQSMRWIFLGLSICFSGCVAGPVLAIEATCEVVSLAARASDPDSATPPTPSVSATAHTDCAEPGAGPDTDCLDYMMQLSDSY
jgi:hypothetical protein